MSDMRQSIGQRPPKWHQDDEAAWFDRQRGKALSPAGMIAFSRRRLHKAVTNLLSPVLADAFLPRIQCKYMSHDT